MGEQNHKKYVFVFEPFKGGNTKMRRLMMIIGITALSASLALAQAPGPGGQRGQGGQGGFRGGQGGPGGMAGGIMLLQRPDVQKELKLSEEQLKTIREKLEAFREGGSGSGGGFPRRDPEQMRERQRQMEEVIKGVLSKEQFERYQQLNLQWEGPMAIGRPDIAQKLNLSEQQQQAVRDAIRAQGEAMRELMQSGDREAAREKREQMRQETGKKILGLLNETQKKQWEEMLGKPFTFENRRP
jgi:Spy/CpxP family protein refolding chaperone